ncbi:hypothetical protein SAMN06295974_3709 [Plantibacter flavus]|uniref:Uncharacterized protein n=1 Tax=Plantibacter flavus TaxID=150123 RepID=A0A3N2BLJ1_9MICO|nr:hypothetical protein EDD42_4096 [Plantibacter flavus]SMG48280.1 hypothetical protein SAMN06295974_3709 [Plantibacter flavus]
MGTLPERKPLKPRSDRPPLQRQPDSGLAEILSPRDESELASRLRSTSDHVSEPASPASEAVTSNVGATAARSVGTGETTTSAASDTPQLPTRKPGRPRKKRVMLQLSTSMEKDLRDTVERWRLENNMSVVDLIDEAVREYLGLEPWSD